MGMAASISYYLNLTATTTTAAADPRPRITPMMLITTCTQSSRHHLKLQASSSSEEAAAGGSHTHVHHVFSVTPPNNSQIDYLGQSTKGDLNINFGGSHGQAPALGHSNIPIEEVARTEAREAQHLLKHLGIPVLSPSFIIVFS